MESKEVSKKQRILDKFTTYVEGNPNASYDDAAKAMRRSPKTIYRWCKKLGIHLTASKADDQLGAALPSTTRADYQLGATLPFTTREEKAGEEEAMDELDRCIDKTKQLMAHIQKRIDEIQNQIADTESYLGK